MIYSQDSGKKKKKVITQLLKWPIVLGILLFPLFSLISCSDDDDDGEICLDEVYTEDITSVDAPETATVGEVIEIPVDFQVMNSCGEFYQFKESGTEMTRTITVEAVYNGCNCAEVIETKTATYEFIPEENGEYTLNFTSGPTEFITVTIDVTESEAGT